eukprot:gene6500-biopygen13707
MDTRSPLGSGVGACNKNKVVLLVWRYWLVVLVGGWWYWLVVLVCFTVGYRALVVNDLIFQTEDVLDMFGGMIEHLADEGHTGQL